MINTNHGYLLVDSQTGDVKSYETILAATRAAERLNRTYGSYRYYATQKDCGKDLTDKEVIGLS